MTYALKHTTQISEGDSKLAARQFSAAIDDLDLVLMIVFGKGDQQEKIVEWADKLAHRLQLAPGYFLRHVVWVRKPQVEPVRAVLRRVTLNPDDLPTVAVLGLFDDLKATLGKDDEITPTTLLNAYAKGQRL